MEYKLHEDADLVTGESWLSDLELHSEIFGKEGREEGREGRGEGGRTDRLTQRGLGLNLQGGIQTKLWNLLQGYRG